MQRLTTSLALAALLLATATTSASAHSRDDGPDEPGSAFGYSAGGFALGALDGLAVGYLATGPHFEGGEWRELVMGAGIGAVAGVASGLALGLSDHMSNERVGAYVLRDMTYGSLLGGSTGAIIGGLVVLETDRPKDVLTGTAIGALAGTGIGLVVGVLEASTAERRRAEDARRHRHGRHHRHRRSLTITLSALSTESGEIVPAPMVSGTF